MPRTATNLPLDLSVHGVSAALTGDPLRKYLNVPARHSAATRSRQALVEAIPDSWSGFAILGQETRARWRMSRQQGTKGVVEPQLLELGSGIRRPKLFVWC